MTVKRDLTIRQGGVYSIKWFRRQADGTTVIPLTDYTAALQARDAYTSNTVRIDASTENDQLIIDEAEGSVTFTLNATETAALPPSKKLVWDIELYPDGDEEQAIAWIEGTITVEPQVTRS